MRPIIGLLAMATIGSAYALPARAQDAGRLDTGLAAPDAATGSGEPAAGQAELSTPDKEPERDVWGVAGHPMFGYAPESRLVLGAGMALYYNSRPDDPDQRLDEYGLKMSYSTREQGTITLDGIKYLHSNDYFVNGDLELTNTPSSFYGIGPRTPASAEEDYSQKAVDSTIAFQAMVAPGLYIGPDYSFMYSSLSELTEGSQLANGTITGSGTGVKSGVGFLATYDSTNSKMYKLSGTRVQLVGRVYHAYLGSSYDFGKIAIDARHFVSLPWRMVLAFHTRLTLNFGDVPFFSLASLGGDKIMRGYSSERYVARHGLAAQTELRYPLFWRFGGVAFVGAAEVENGLADFGTTVRMAGGLGLRFAINKRQTINMRLDLTYNSDGEFEKYLKLREAF